MIIPSSDLTPITPQPPVRFRRKLVDDRRRHRGGDRDPKDDRRGMPERGHVLRFEDGRLGEGIRGHRRPGSGYVQSGRFSPDCETGRAAVIGGGDGTATGGGAGIVREEIDQGGEEEVGGGETHGAAKEAKEKDGG